MVTIYGINISFRSSSGKKHSINLSETVSCRQQQFLRMAEFSLKLGGNSGKGCKDILH